MGEKEIFLKVYSFLPIEERKLTVVIIDSQPISWARAYLEIKEDTALGKRILKKLEERGLI
jgi:hypothetical protein